MFRRRSSTCTITRARCYLVDPPSPRAVPRRARSRIRCGRVDHVGHDADSDGHLIYSSSSIENRVFPRRFFPWLLFVFTLEAMAPGLRMGLFSGSLDEVAPSVGSPCRFQQRLSRVSNGPASGLRSWRRADSNHILLFPICEGLIAVTQDFAHRQTEAWLVVLALWLGKSLRLVRLMLARKRPIGFYGVRVIVDRRISGASHRINGFFSERRIGSPLYPDARCRNAGTEGLEAGV